jgi:hypothetical protein
MRRKSILWILIGLSLLFVTSAAGFVVIKSHFSYDLLTAHDGRKDTRTRWAGEWLTRFGEAILPFFAPEDTDYAVGYNEKTFKGILIGASEEEVVEKLGEPLAKRSFPEPIMKDLFPDGSTAWYYSQHGPSSKSYFVRMLVFDAEGRVFRKYREYYVD